MIQTFHCKHTEAVFHRRPTKEWPPDRQKKCLRKLLILDAATSLSDLKVPPGNRLEKLTADRVGQYSIRVDSQWRICFRWTPPNAYDVEMVDYHR